MFVKERQLRACLETLGYEGPYGMPYDGASPSDEWLVDHLMRRRDFDDEGKCLILQSWLERVVNVPPECDSEYRQPVSSPSLAEERDQEDALLSQDSKYKEDADSQELRDLRLEGQAAWRQLLASTLLHQPHQPVHVLFELRHRQHMSPRRRRRTIGGCDGGRAFIAGSLDPLAKVRDERA